MNTLVGCKAFCESLGFGCETLDFGDGSVVALDTPFEFSDGTGLTIYAEHLGPKIRFFDAGETLFHAYSRGIRSFHAREYQPIRTLIDRFGASVNGNGEIELYGSSADTPGAFAHFVQSLLALVDWETKNLGMDVSHTRQSRLVQEARFYLAAIKPDVPVLPAAQRFRGLSGREYAFHLEQGGTWIDAVSANHIAASSELHKIADIRGKPATRDMEITVVIDDRSMAKAAEQEATVISQFATVWKLSDLVTKVAPSNQVPN